MRSGKPPKAGRVLNRSARERSLIQAAGKLFASHGYEPTTTRAIASAAGCAEGLISRYFGGKAGLLRALIEFHFSEELAEANEEPPPASTVEEEVLHAVLSTLDHLWEDHEFLRVIVPQLCLNAELAREVKVLGPDRHVERVLRRLRKHEKFCAIPLEEQQCLAQVIHMLGFELGFWRPVLGEDLQQTRERAVIIAKMFSRIV